MDENVDEKKLILEAEKRITWVCNFGTGMHDEYYKNVDDIRNSALSLDQKRGLLIKLRGNDSFVTKLNLQKVPNQSQSCHYTGIKQRLFHKSKIQGDIEGRHGSSVYSVFKLIKWVSCLNFVNAAIIFFLIYLPHSIKDRKQTNESDLICNFYDNRYVNESKSSECCSQLHEERSNDAWNFFSNDSGDSFIKKVPIFIQDIFQGTNWLAYSPVFYGYYEGTYKFKIGSVSYDFPLAYFLVMLMIFLINLFAVVKSSSRSFKSISKSGERNLSLINIVFTGWNHFDIRNKRQKENLHGSFLNVFNLSLSLLEKDERKKNQSQSDKVKQTLLRIFINVVTISILIVTGYYVVHLNSVVIPTLFEEYECESRSDAPFYQNFKCFLIRYLSAFTILVIGTAFPFIFEKLVSLEDYEHKTSLVILIGRSLVVRLGTIILTYWSFLQAVNCQYMRGCVLDNGDVLPKPCQPASAGINVKACSNENNSLGYCKKVLCWENYVGNQIYTLAVMDLLSTIASILLIDLPRSLLLKRIFPILGRIEFNIGNNVLNTVDSQTICWLGLFYAPFLPLIIALINFMLYYIKSIYLLKVCTPVFSESKSSPLFKYFLLISFICCTILTAITIYTTEPSIACGPFRNIDCSNVYSGVTVFCITYDYIIQSIMNQALMVQAAIFFFGESLVLGVIVAILVILLYFVYAYMIAEKKFNSELKFTRNKILIENKNLWKELEEKRLKSKEE